MGADPTSDRRAPQQIKLDAFTRWLLGVIASLIGVVAVGWAAWAGVVWDARQMVIDLKTEVTAMRGDVGTLSTLLERAERDRAADQVRLEMRQDEHEDERWHEEAGNAIAVMKASLARMEQQLERIEGRMP